MSDKFWLTEAQLTRLKPFFPRSRGVPRVDDRRVISGIIHVIRNGLRWRDAEPRRVCRRLIWFSYAAMASVSRAA